MIQVSGKIDDYVIENKNLAPVKNSDKKFALNSAIRKGINNGAGESVVVSLFLENENKVRYDAMILECFKDAEALSIFKK